MNYTVWDIETSTKTEFKRKANPFSPENYVVCHGFSRGAIGAKDMGTPKGEYFGIGDALEDRIAACKNLPPDWFQKLLKGTKVLVGQNIKFDILYAIANPNSNCEANLAAWMEWVTSGGILWDIQLAEYLLRGMEQSSQMMSLDEIAPAYGGNVKFDEVKALWNAGVPTIEIPEDLLMRYLVGGDGEHGDIGNTELVFLKQFEKAKKDGQLRSILLNMGSLIFTIEAERNGMFVDKELGLKLAAELKEKLDLAVEQLRAYLPEDLPFDFNWSSRFHKSALIFGGPVKYKARAVVKGDDGEPVYYQKDEVHVLLADDTTLELDAYMKLALEGTAPEAQRFAGGKNKGEVKTKKVKVKDIERGPKTRIEDFEYHFDGFTKPDKRWASSEPGVYSTAANVIEELGNRDIPFLKTLSEVQAMTKDLGTYFIVVDEETGEEKGMLTLVQLDSIIHHSLNHTSTVTARLSSSNPNLQNLSKGQKSNVKLVFRSRFGEEGVICQSDFSSLEVFIQAILTGDEQLIADLAAGVDMHCMRLAVKEKMPYEEVLHLCKGKGVDPEVQSVWDYKRTKAKVFSFQRAYGAGVAKIASSTGMTEEEVQALVDAENERYPKIEEFYNRLTATIKKNRKPTSKTIEHPDKRGLMVQLGKSFSRTPDGKLYCYWESPSPSYLLDKGVLSSFSPTEIKNYVVQGGGGEWAKAAMWLSVRAFYHFKNFDGKALLVNQVHDAEYGDFHKSVAAKAAALLHTCMEEASTFMEWWFKWELPIGVPSDTVWGPSMMDEGKIDDPIFGKAVDKLRPWLRKRFIGGHQPSWLH
ncbi:DNA polymerase [Ralstonia phage RS-PI-1]|uniref:DNA polymerase n=1 Tax=Ralstonia phage RS-PI-1 TaxID=1958965 RepID=A0A1S6L1F3_9CAUD|nr:DNA polymerase [Ralstonia phage RS-PI-1]AQT27793.1 DNA polymerase I [Ralstonia phage RS-PI-1]